MADARTGVDSCDPGTICGVVRTGAGHPLPAAACRLYAGDAPLGMRFARGLRSREPAASVLSDATGAFSLPAPSGHWTLEVEYVGLRRWREESVASGSYRRVLLERAGILVLRVEDEQGESLSDVRVLLLDNPYSNPGSARAAARSDVTGRAEIELQPGGSWFVELSHPAYRSTTFAVPASRDAAVLERTVTLSTGVRVLGRVTDPRRGRVPAGAEVLVDAWAPGETRTLSCDARGRFDSGPVFPAEAQLELTARAPGYAEVRSVIDLAKATVRDGELEVELVLESEEVRVLGRVLTTDGLPPGPVDLFLQPIAPGNYLEARRLTPTAVRWRRQASTDGAGEFEVAGLMARHAYQLLVLPRNRYDNALVRIPAQEPGTFFDLGEIRVAAGGTIFGFARNEDGTPVPHLPVVGIAGIHVTLAQSRDPGYFPDHEAARQDAFTDQDGRFELALLPEGTTYDLYWGEGRTDGDRHVGTFTIRSGETIGPVEIVVPSEPGGDEVVLNGIVTDSSGAPLGTVLVEAWSGPETHVIGEGFEAGQLTDAGGTFALAGLSSTREYRLTATDLRGRFERTSTFVPRPREGEFASLILEPSQTPPSPLEGTVTDAEGRPLADIDLTLYLSPLLARCDCLSWACRTDEQGRFHFGLVEAGEHRVTAVDRQGRFRPTLVPARPGRSLPIRME